MPKPISFGKMEFRLVSSMEDTGRTPESETPFRILVMGDFSGRANRGMDKSERGVENRGPILVDRDNLDEVLARLGAEIGLPLLGEKAPPVPIGFSEMEDFHPDRLYKDLELFQALRDTRSALEDPSTFAAMAAELRGVNTDRSKPERDLGEVSQGITDQTSAGLLDQIIEQTSGETDIGSSRPISEWDAFLHTIVRPHLVPEPHPRLEGMLASVTAAAGELMRRILHTPDFQDLESAWRGMDFLVRRLETDVQLEVYLLDISKMELAEDLGATEDLRSTELHRVLVEETLGTPGGEPWAVITGNYLFERNRGDLELLGRITRIAKAAGAPFIAGASDTWLCGHSLAETPDPDDWHPRADPEAEEVWQALRHLPEAAYLGLVLPRFLLRLPYGADTEPTESFDFEEMPSGSDHKAYLWGNSCFACVLLLGQAFTLQNWQLRPGSLQEITHLPVHIFRENSETRMKSCAETGLSQRAAEIILDKGLMPLLSFLNQDTVRLARFQAVAEPLTPLRGRWG